MLRPLRQLAKVRRAVSRCPHTQALTNDLGSGRASGAEKGTARMAIVLKINPGFDASYPWREIGTGARPSPAWRCASSVSSRWMRP